ncbi:MAG TPA: hypothetical protein VHG09_14880, partial [Longimicrobiales bacterium]|nr:hypothetical protein [Longimicrobiales bacterium]
GEYVSASSASDREWHVFDRKGSWLGSVSLPARFLPYQIGATWILGSSRNELDVETVQVLRLSRQPSGET